MRETIDEILDEDLSREDTLDEIMDLVSEAEANAAEAATDAVDESRNDDLDAAENEWREIVASFERGYMNDVRWRLMDMGQRAFRDNAFVMRFGARK